MASAYNRLNRTSAEGGLQPKEYLAKYGADRVRTRGAVWLGSTLGCAECHDHKFDPFTPRDFYSMKAFFADIKETGLVPDRGKDAWGSQLALPTPEQQKRLDQLKQALDDAKARLAAKMKSLEPRRAEWEKQLLAALRGGRTGLARPAAHSARNRPTARCSRSITTRTWTTPATTAARLAGTRAPGNGADRRQRSQSRQRDLHRHAPARRGHVDALGLEVVQDESLPGTARGARRRPPGDHRGRSGGGRPQGSVRHGHVQPEQPGTGVSAGAARSTAIRRPAGRSTRTTRPPRRFSRCASRSRCRPPPTPC